MMNYGSFDGKIAEIEYYNAYNDNLIFNAFMSYWN